MSTRAYGLIVQRVPSRLGVNFRRLRHLPKPSTTHSCKSSKAPKTPLLERPDGGQMPARCRKLMQIVSEFPRATTSAKQLEHRLCTLLHTTGRRRAGRNGLQDQRFRLHVKMSDTFKSAPD